MDLSIVTLVDRIGSYSVLTVYCIFKKVVLIYMYKYVLL